MKKIIIGILLAFFLSASVVWAESTRTATLTADAKVTTGRGFITGIIVMTDGTNNVTVEIYDNVTAGGEKIIPTWIIPTSATNRSSALSFGGDGEPFDTGIYVDITTSGTVSYMVYYEKR